MDHHDALERGLVEKYLLNELSPPERDAFEEHYFDCRECAEDLRTTAAFLDAAKRELGRGVVGKSEANLDDPKVGKPGLDKPRGDDKRPDPGSRWNFLWKPAFLSPALAASLLVIAYQNGVLYPRLAAGPTASRTPEILASVSLIGGNSRGAAVPSVTLPPTQPLLLTLDIPTAERFTSYTCLLMSPSGAVEWRVPVSPDQAKDTVSIRVPAGRWRSGDYRLVVQGHAPSPEQEPAELASYRFTVN